MVEGLLDTEEWLGNMERVKSFRSQVISLVIRIF